MTLSETSVTATMVANLVTCERRVRNDIHADPARAEAVGGFVELLWSQGSRHEGRVLEGLGTDLLDLRGVPLAQRAAATRMAMSSGAAWIAGGRLELGDRVGMPDLLHATESGWAAGDVKSGSPRAPGGVHARREYAAQAGFYAGMMEDGGWGRGDRCFVIGPDGTPDWYDMDDPIGRDGPAMRDWVAGLTGRVRLIRDRDEGARAALCAACALCRWRTLCRGELEAGDDLTLVPGLGRAIRDGLEGIAPTVTALAGLDVAEHRLKGGRTTVRGLGGDRLSAFQERARVLRTPGAVPYATRPLGLARMRDERHLDLETDPTDGNFVYLHGVHWRRAGEDGDEESFVHFLAERRSEERDAFAAAFRFLTENPEALVTTYSAFEKTTYRMLARRYPEVVSAGEIEAFFERPLTVDLYLDHVVPHTVWPLTSYGLKKIARHLGFEWRDVDPSGAASIAWFVEYQRTGDPALRRRILEYNADDCEASKVVFDGLIALPPGSVLPWPPRGDAA